MSMPYALPFIFRSDANDTVKVKDFTEFGVLGLSALGFGYFDSLSAGEIDCCLWMMVIL